MNRRTFLTTAAAGCAALALPPARARAAGAAVAKSSELRTLMRELLRDWGDGLLRLQIDDPAQPQQHGAFRCPACGFVHGRCGDAVYPLLHLAEATGQMRYRDAALRLSDWMKNVDAPDGAWTNEFDPKSWKGITVFAAIALAESLRHHGVLLDAERQARWRSRLRRAADFILEKFNMEYGNINYGVTATYGLALCAEVLGEPKYRARARALAQESLQFLSEPSRLLFGEGHPADRLSPKKCRPVDLGYNVEESLPSLAQYALLEKDAPVLQAVLEALAAHLEFMLPDGGWDNGWGTRSFKWTYWGSRTSDGCQAAFALLAERNPALGAAALRNTQLLRACTRDGLLHGGPHYASHGVPPCVHHTFAHAKALAAALQHGDALDRVDGAAPLPRAAARGVRAFPEIDTYLAAQGPWRATVTGYDWLYKEGLFHATGGALSLLWHAQLGPLFAASLARYVMAEAHNMQPNPDGEDFALTPRVELRAGGAWCTNLFDLGATIRPETQPGAIAFAVETRLVSAEGKDPAGGPVRMKLGYRFTDDAVTITAQPVEKPAGPWALVLPLISAKGEAVRVVSERRLEVVKPGGTVVLECSVPLRRLPSARERVFNPVPGMEAIPLAAEGSGAAAVECVLRRGP